MTLRSLIGGSKVLSKRTILLDRFARNDGGGIVFKQPFDEDMPHACRDTMKLSPDVWREMGEPEAVTLTVEVGDTLNA